MKILIAGMSVYGLENISDDSMLYSFVNSLKEKIDDLEVVMMVRHVENYLTGYSIDKFIANFDYTSKSESLGKRFKGFNLGDDHNKLSNVYENLINADLLIIGGDPFIEITLEPYRGVLPYAEMLITLARFMGIPVLLHGIHFGRPPTSEFGISKMNFCIDNATYISTRAEEPYLKLKNDYYGCFYQNKVVLHTDDAYGLKDKSIFENSEINDDDIHRWIADTRSSGKKIVLLTLRVLYWVWEKEEREEFFSTIAEFLKKVVDELDCKFIFFPHCTYSMDHFWEDDRPGHVEIAKLLPAGISYIIDRRIEITEIGGIFENIDFAFGNRRHTGVFSAMKRKPFMLFGESSHVKPIYNDMGIREDLFIDYIELTTENLFEKFKLMRTIDNVDQLELSCRDMSDRFNSGINLICRIIFNG